MKDSGYIMNQVTHSPAAKENMLRNPKKMRFDPSVDTGLGDGGKVELDFVRELIQGADVLNIGCWTGTFERKSVELAASMTSVDVEPKALEVARTNVPAAKFIEASILDLPFPDQSFDLVTLWAVIEHIPVGTEPRALSEIARVLRRGGYLALGTPNSHLLSRLFDPAYLIAGHRHYAASELSTKLIEAGFSVSNIETLGGWYSILGVLIFYTWKWLFHRRPPDWEWFANAQKKDEESRGFNTLYILAQRKF